MLDLTWFRWELMAALGLVAACGPGTSSASGSGDGSGSISGSASSTGNGTSTTGTQTSTTGTRNGCGDPPLPPNAVAPRDCANPVPETQPGFPDAPSGWETCSGGRHRTQAVTCMLPDGATGTCDPVNAATTECMTDADCDGGSNGFCNNMYEPFGGPQYCGCNYACETDADCPDGQLCECDGVASYCKTAYCSTDADCRDGYHCWDNGSFAACDTPFDTCRSSGDCPGEICPVCEYQPDLCAAGCSDVGVCTVGRPFLVAGRERTARAVGGSAWCPEIDLATPAPVEPAVRDALVAHWTRAGLAEHASVAAFARFALQLVGLGAPPELLHETAIAMADEVEHARLCFGLARHHGGAPVSPGPIDTTGAVDPRVDLVAVAELAAREACIGETLAAVEAAASAAEARDPSVHAILERIAADELRHAALGWRFVAWALARSDRRGRERIHDALLDAARLANKGAMGTDDAGELRLRPHGVLSPSARARLARQTVRDVVEPLVATVTSGRAELIDSVDGASARGGRGDRLRAGVHAHA